MTVPLITHKRGDTFSYVGSVALPEGTWTATCQLRTAGGDAGSPAATITCTLGTLTDGEYPLTLFASSQDTSTWRATLLYGDIQFSNSDYSPPQVISTDTFTVQVVKDQTHA